MGRLSDFQHFAAEAAAGEETTMAGTAARRAFTTICTIVAIGARPVIAVGTA